MTARSKDRLVGEVAQYLRKHGLLAAGNRVTAAVSGGADSVALLEMLLELRQRLAIRVSVAHFNHHLRGEESDQDERFVEELAESRGLRLFKGGADVAAEARKRGENLEGTARALRHHFFRGLVERGETDCIATGHTADDQAETVLARLLRGAGTRGLAGIHPKVVEVQSPKSKVQSCGTPDHRPQTSDHPWLIRPLLAVRRARLRNWLMARGQVRGARCEVQEEQVRGARCELRGDTSVPSCLEPRTSNLEPGAWRLEPRTSLWREDSSNLDLRFARNRLRAQVLPALEAFNPRLVEQLAQTADMARDEEEYWNERVRLLLAFVTKVEAGGAVLKLHVPSFLQLSRAEQRRVVRGACALACPTGQFDSANVEAIRQLVEGQSGRRFVSGRLEVTRAFDTLEFRTRPPGDVEPYEFQVPVPGSCRLPCGSQLVLKLVNRGLSDWSYNEFEGCVLDARLVPKRVTVRNWKPGDTFDSPAGTGTRKIKTLLLQRRVPLSARKGWPVIVSGERVMWVRGFPVSRQFRPGPDSDSGIWIQELREEEAE
jgi:tRNA(Ile)-lysidine synthase